jgi:hypothetical protein
VNELMSRPEITADNARFVASPIPVAVHIVSVTVYSLLGALQFVPLLRRGRHKLAPHRGADPGSRGRARGAHRSLDELFLSSPA